MKDSKLYSYYLLTKPGIIRGNLLTVTGGFLFASRDGFDLTSFIGALIGSALIVGSGCVFNNYIDRNMDKAMKRTKKRALVTGIISPKAALTFGTLLGLTGFGTLALLTNAVTILVGLVGFIFYVIFYSIWKRRSPNGTLVGSVSGAIPPVAGYTAASGQIDNAAIILFAILTMWQMPHFYAIALFRSKEYAAANVPVLPLVNGIGATKRFIIGYILVFIFSTGLLTVFGGAGYIYLVVMLLTGCAWLYVALSSYTKSDTDRWAKTVFGMSLLTLLLFSLIISLDGLFNLP